MTFEELLSLLSETVSGMRAREAVERIASYHRVQASPGYDDALDFVRRTLESLKIETAVHDFRADGRSRSYEGWVSPPAWKVSSGTLRQLKPKPRTLGTYADCPQLVIVHSPGGSVEAELVHVGAGTRDADYEGLAVSGRFVLASGRASEVVKKAAARGAVGLVVYPDSERASASHDLVQYASFFPKSEEIRDLVPSFSVSRRTADELLKQLSKGEVQLHGEVDSTFIEGGHLRVLEAWIPGADQDGGEVLLVSHLCHPRPSANDNASGSAVLLELARVFREIRARIPLRTGIRLLWVPEFYGTIPWASANVHALRRVHFVLNLDMVGQSPEIVGTPLDIFRVPNATPHYLNACVGPVASAVAALGGVVPGASQRVLHWRMNVPSGGSDHLVFGASPHELPALMLGHDDPYWHTSLDTVEKVDATRLKHVAMVAAALASVPSMIDEASHIPEWLLSYSVERLTVAFRLAKGLDPASAHRLVALARDIEEERIESLADLEWSDRRVGDIRGLVGALHSVYQWMETALPTDGDPAPTSDVRPLRATDGPLPYGVTDGFDDDEAEFFRRTLGLHHRAVASSLFGLCDGTRTIAEIAWQLSLDFDRLIAAEDVARGVALLAKAGCLET
jgi:hypothetical protein